MFLRFEPCSWGTVVLHSVRKLNKQGMRVKSSLFIGLVLGMTFLEKEKFMERE
jgi:hypothetical protein